MKQDKKTTKVNITLPLEGEEAEMFLQFQRLRFLNNNTQTARMLLLPALQEEIAKLMPHGSAKKPLAA